MTEPVPLLMENSIQIAWDYLDATGELGDPVGQRLQRHRGRHLLRLDQSAKSAHRVLEVLPLWHRWLADLSSRDLDVLLAQHADHVAGRQVA